MKKAPKKPSGERTSLSGKRALLEAAQDRLRNEAWLLRQKDKATEIGGSTKGTKSSSASLEVEQDYIVIEDANPPSKMRRVILPSQESSQQSAQPTIQPSSLPLIPLSQEWFVDQLEEPAPERIRTEMTSILVAQPKTASAVARSEIAPLSTPMPQPAIATVSQEFPATPVTAQTLLLLTSTPIFDKIASPTVSEPHQSSINHSHHTEKIPSEEPSSAEVPLNAT